MFDALTSIAMNLFYLLLGIGGYQSFPPPLSSSEEKELFTRMHNEKDGSARAKLIEHNLRLVSHIVRKYYASSQMQEDLVSIGSLGLIKAIDSFDISNGARFATYAAKCIQNEILMFFRSQKKLCCEVSINETIDIDREGNPLTYIDIISCDDTIADDLEVKVRLEKALLIIKEVLDVREREILVMRYGLADTPPMTQKEVADKLRISRSYVSRIEKRAIEKIRSRFDDLSGIPQKQK